MAEKKKLRVGVVGVGYVARNNFLPALSRMEDLEIVGLAAGHLENARRAQRLCGAQQAVETLEDLAGLGLDCAFVLTPKECHARQVAFLLGQGIHVYSEKPMATTLAEAAALAELSEKTGRKLMIGFNRRYAPVCQKAREVYAHRVPDVIIAQKNRPQTEYHATLENAIHMVDLLRFFGGEAEKVDAIARFTDPDYETFTTAQIRFENGAAGLLVADRSAGQWQETLEIHGGGRSVRLCMPDSISITDGEGSHLTEMTPMAMGWARLEDKMGFTGAICHFLDCVRQDREPLTSAADAYKTHELLNRILKSAGLPGME